MVQPTQCNDQVINLVQIGHFIANWAPTTFRDHAPGATTLSARQSAFALIQSTRALVCAASALAPCLVA
eukprot:COSAG02_NODE_26069_length_642_cov_0.563536_2_plen_68_part_01